MTYSIKLASARTLLFVPANRPERFLKACRSGADAVILDLEDSVPLTEKSEARMGVMALWADLSKQQCSIVIRINSPDTEWGLQDLNVLQNLKGLSGLMLPKCESSKTLRLIAQSHPGVACLPIIESALGYLSLNEISAAENVLRLVLGHVDFVADTGLMCSEDQSELNSLRFQMAMFTKKYNLASAIDGITLEVDNEALIRQDVNRSLRFGFGGKLCIHPKQVPLIHAEFAPTEQQIYWAQRVVACMSESKGAAIQLDGKMVDLPVVLQAQRILARII